MESKPKQVKNGTRTYLINGDYIKFHTVFKDGSEIVEEYGIYSEELESRRVKKIGMTGKEQWTTEIGEELKPRSIDEFLIRENDNNPLFIRKDTQKEFQWRIRNLKGDADNFMVECDKDKQQIVIRTKNKKYYKRFGIPDLERLNLKLDESLMKVNFVNNTLIISYTKPKEALEAESEILGEIRRIRAEIKKNPNAKYDPGCQNQ